MKTLILNGSPRRTGDTTSMLDMLVKALDGEHLTITAYDCSISPCIDCRYCHRHSGCAIKDGMQEVYDYLSECDNVIIASPVYFSELTGKLLCVASRLQTYFCARAFRNEDPGLSIKKGGIILAGGGNGSPDRAIATARLLLRHMGCRDIFEPVMSLNTDRLPAIEDKAALQKLGALADYFNGR